MNCNPCDHCVHYACYEDRSTGWIDEDCKVGGDFVYEGARPCSQFAPIPASQGLIEQIEDEREYQDWLEEQEEEKREKSGQLSTFKCMCNACREKRGEL